MTAAGTRPRRRRRDHPRGLLDWLALLPVLALAAFMAWEARLFFAADMNLLEARWLIGAWASGERPMTPASWLRAYDATQRAIATHPQDAHLHVQLGVLYQMAATMPRQAAEQQQAFRRQAAGQYRRALVQRPDDPWSWASLAELQQAIEPGAPAAWEAWRRALRHGPHEDAVQISLLRAGFSGWAQAPADVKAWITALYEQTPPARRPEIDQLALAWGAPEWRGPVTAPPLPDVGDLLTAAREALAKGLPPPQPPELPSFMASPPP